MDVSPALYKNKSPIDGESRVAARPLVSLVVPAYNEASLVDKHLTELCHQMESLEHEYRWEVVVVNDGSTDETGVLAEAFARARNNIHVLHHSKNFGLGQAFRTAFQYCRGDYIVTLDMDLSYSPDHIEKLLSAITKTNAKIVVASPIWMEEKFPMFLG